MNTANLQLEGLYAAVAALMTKIRDKGVLTADEIDSCLMEAETINADNQRRELSPANVEAVRFPFRYLRAANRAGMDKAFFDIATEIGMTKDDAAAERPTPSL